jgi:hypothetical protein
MQLIDQMGLAAAGLAGDDDEVTTVRHFLQRIQQETSQSLVASFYTGNPIAVFGQPLLRDLGA